MNGVAVVAVLILLVYAGVLAYQKLRDELDAAWLNSQLEDDEDVCLCRTLPHVDCPVHGLRSSRGRE